MLRLLLCDDDPCDLKHVQTLAEAYYGGAAEVLAFSAPKKALQYVENGGGADIALLDILMPGMAGTVLAQRLRRQGFGGRIVFLTSSNGYAAESYQVEAFAYLLKPVTQAALYAVLDRVAAPPPRDAAYFSVKQGKKVRQIRFAELMYMEVLDHRLYFHLAGGEVAEAYATLAEYAPILLRDPRCGRCHKSLVVNMDYVECMDGHVLHMRDGRQMPVSRNYAEFRAQYLRWVFDREGGE